MTVEQLTAYYNERYEQFVTERRKMGMSVEIIKHEGFLNGVKYAIDALNTEKTEEEKPE